MKIVVGKTEVEILKSVGRMLTLMIGTDLPLVRYVRGGFYIYTIEPLGPEPHDSPLWDWRRSSPTKFEQKTICDALVQGYVELNIREGVDERLILTERGREVALACLPWWSPEIDQHFAGRGIDWRDLGKPFVPELSIAEKKALRKAKQHADNVALAHTIIREALKSSGYVVGEDGLLVAPKKVCTLVNAIGNSMAELLDRLDPSPAQD